VQITDNQIKFTITDSGKIIAVNNENIINHDGYQGAATRAYQGKAIAIIKASKDDVTITLKTDA
jgi:beta-galactosidase